MIRSSILLLSTMCGLVQAQTISIVSGNGQLVPANLAAASAPIVFQVTSNGAPVSGQLVTFTSTSGTIGNLLAATSLVTNAQGQVTNYYAPGTLLNVYSFVSTTFEAAAGSSSVLFQETTFYVAPNFTYDVLPDLLVAPASGTVPYTAPAGSPGSPFKVRVYVQYGAQAGEPIAGIAVRPVLVAPTGTAPTQQSVKCAEPTDAEGNVFTDASGIATCTPVFLFPNQAFAQGTNNPSFKLAAGGTFAFGPFPYNISAAPLAIGTGPVKLVVPAGQPVPTPVTATGGTAPYSFALTSTSGPLPPGVTLQSNGTFAGSSTVPGIYTFTVQATDKNGATATSAAKNFSIAVSGGPLTLNPSVVPPAVVGLAYSQTVSVQGGVPPYTITLVGNPPAGLTVTPDPSGLSVKVSGTPTTPSVAPLALNITDSVGTTTVLALGGFKVVSALAVANVNPQLVSVGNPFTLTIQASNGLAPYTFTATGLPAGLAISSGGVISGQPSGPPGVSAVTVAITDAAGQSVSVTFNIEVSGGTIALSGSSTLPAATAGTAYQTQLTFTGGVPPYSYTVSGNSAVTVSSTGVLSGMFTQAGSQSVTVTVTDQAGKSQAFALTIPVSSSVSTILSAASFLGGPVAPGEVVSIFGGGLGPEPGIGSDVSNGVVSTSLGGTQVSFGSTLAPILYASATQLNVIVPFDVVPGATVQVTVTAGGLNSNTLPVTVAATAPGIFKVGTTPADNRAAALNPDYTLNDPTNPVARGSFVAFYATGGGVFSTSLGDGVIPTTIDSLAATATVTIGGQAATVLYAGVAPGFAGIVQVNVSIPQSVTPGTAVPVVLTVGGADSSKETATIAVQ